VNCFQGAVQAPAGQASPGGRGQKAPGFRRAYPGGRRRRPARHMGRHIAPFPKFFDFVRVQWNNPDSTINYLIKMFIFNILGGYSPSIDAIPRSSPNIFAFCFYAFVEN
jgi:hypothetical protein